MRIDLNSDLGESFGSYRIGMDDEVIKYVSSVNVACGWHAGDPVIMERTVRMAKENGVAVGAHPGFDDKQGFGRRKIQLPADEIRVMMKYQIGALMAFLQSEGMKMQHVKPHGALYNMAMVDGDIADAVCKAIYEVDPSIYLLAPAGCEMDLAAQRNGLKIAREVFADRAYQEDGTLVPRSLPGAVLHDPEEILARVLRMGKEGKVTTIDGNDIDISADSICVHGDNEKALRIVETIKNGLEQAGIELRNFGEEAGKVNRK